ncbi:hypothetical protein MD484_g3736, partial [Candolleomyces efflorescens]
MQIEKSSTPPLTPTFRVVAFAKFFRFGSMDFLKDVAKTAVDAANNRSDQPSNDNANSSNVDVKDNNNNGLGFATGNSAVDGVLGKLNGALGGGKQAVDMFQEKVLKEGAQDNESAAEQAKDKMIADALRSGYKNVTGKDIPSSISNPN